MIVERHRRLGWTIACISDGGTHEILAWLGVIFSIMAADPVLAQANRSVVLVLDASGSMNARLANGQTRIEAAKIAVAELAREMDGETRLSLWAYGHQAPT